MFIVEPDTAWYPRVLCLGCGYQFGGVEARVHHHGRRVPAEGAEQDDLHSQHRGHGIHRAVHGLRKFSNLALLNIFKLMILKRPQINYNQSHSICKENIANEFRKIQWRLTTWKQQRDTN